MRLKHCFLFILLLLSIVNISEAQTCSALGQTPATAFPVCGTTTFVQNRVPICNGRTLQVNCTNNTFEDVNPFYYRFTCYTAGTLAFTIAPVNANDDYDWVLYDITNRNPSNIYTNRSWVISENWSGEVGNTGASAAGTRNTNCAGGGIPLFNAMPNLVVGHEYLLMVSYFTASTFGYTLNFNGGTAVITDPLDPHLTTASINCDGTQATVRFNKKMRCNSLAANGSDFTVAGATIASVTGFGCSTAFDMDSVLLTFSAPLAPGNYNVVMATGSDGNTIQDNCAREIPAGESAGFTVIANSPLPMGPANAPGNCIPSSITLQFPEPIRCNTLAANGSDFTITGPQAISITGATATCNASGETQTVTLQFNAPAAAAGTYQIAMATGTDGNTLLGACSRSVTTGATTSFVVAAQTPLPMGTADAPTDCIPSAIIIQFPEAFLCSTLAANGSDFVVTGPEAVTITAATATCNGAGESQSVVLTFSGPVLTPGNYQIAMAVGSDGNTLTGACNRSVTAAQTTSFTVAPQPPLPMGTIPDPGCAPNSITISFTDPLLCASIATDGSDFQITGPSAVTIIGATGNCNATTTSITIQLAGNILTSGTYNLIVANGTDGNTLIGSCNRRIPAGSSVSFTIAPQPPLPAGALAPVSCAPTTLTINLPEPVNCGSINVSDFQITGPAPVTITDITNACTGPATIQTITLTLNGPVSTPGTYQLEFVTGTDGNTLVGPCMRTVPAGSTLNFTVPVVPPVQMNSIAPITCSPTSLRLIFDDNIRCASVAANGSDFMLNGPPGITITGASATCDAAGLTKEVNLQLSAPIVLGGNYSVQLATGSDGNTVLSECYRPTPAGASVNFVAWDTVSARFTYTIAYDCEQDQLTFTHDGAHQVNNWSWQLNGTTVSTAASFTTTLSASSTNTVVLTVSNPGCTATHTEQIVLDNKVTANFTIDPTACPDDSVRVVNTSTGQIDNWEWNFGNGMTSTLQQPRPVTYPLTGTETNYTVTLTVSNAAGCRASVSKPVQVLSSCLIAVPTGFTPNGDGLNDYFYPLNAFKADNLHFRVYNRWGQVVFESRDWTKKWDGRINGLLQPTGVYVWMLEYIHRDTRQKVSQKGTTTLIR